MRTLKFYLLPLLAFCLITTNSCSQPNTKQTTPTILYVGSTPCDSLIKSSLQITTAENCEFIKWELVLSPADSTFHLTALHGEGQPNTNGFKGGGTNSQLTGVFSTGRGAPANPNAMIYFLKPKQVPSQLLLIEMDSNVLHFVDGNKKLIVGNGGWGYVLNRIKH